MTVALSRRTLPHSHCTSHHMKPLSFRDAAPDGLHFSAVKPRAAISWSGGKDCCTALLRTHADYDIVAMLTMFTDDGQRSRSHGLRPEIVAAHAERLGLTSVTGRCSWDSYTEEFGRMLASAANLGVSHVIFGDIMGDPHRAWDE